MIGSSKFCKNTASKKEYLKSFPYKKINYEYEILLIKAVLPRNLLDPVKGPKLTFLLLSDYDHRSNF